MHYEEEEIFKNFWGRAPLNDKVICYACVCMASFMKNITHYCLITYIFLGEGEVPLPVWLDTKVHPRVSRLQQRLWCQNFQKSWLQKYHGTETLTSTVSCNVNSLLLKRNQQAKNTAYSPRTILHICIGHLQNGWNSTYIHFIHLGPLSSKKSFE